MVDVAKFQVFLVAAETENFSAMAHQLGLGQPAISCRTQSLEPKLGEIVRACRETRRTDRDRA